MKIVYLIAVLSLFLILSCNKEENNKPTGDIKNFNVYLDLQKTDGSSYNEGEIEAKGAYINKNGDIIFLGDWFQLPVSSNFTEIFGKPLFGPFEIGVSSENSGEPEPETEWVHNQLLLLRYQGISEIDTLRGRDSSKYPDFRYFDLYKNDTLIERLNNLEAPWKIIIQK